MQNPRPTPSGGDLIARVLVEQGVRTLFALCGGHIAPILVSSRQAGLRIVDTRDEATAVFAADAEARLTGVPGVAAVTAGPGITNAITALKNAQMATSPLVVFCGATATVLKGRGSLQDIDQESLLLPHVKWFASARRVRDLVPIVREAFGRALAGVPGPTCVECPVDLLYAEPVVRQWYGLGSPGSASLAARLQRAYLRFHLSRVFAGSARAVPPPAAAPRDASPGAVKGAVRYQPAPSDLRAFARHVRKAERPVLVVGSQAIVAPGEVDPLAAAVAALNVPTYLSGMARGLLGGDHPLQVRHQRRQALRDADLVILAGVPCDFRLDYGRHLSRRAAVVAINRSDVDLRKNRRPSLAIPGDPDLALRRVVEVLAGTGGAGGARSPSWPAWTAALRGRDAEREQEIDGRAGAPTGQVNPLALFRALDRVLPDDAVLVADGGDFVATGSYVLRPRRPLSWLDPGVFGTLGVGAGFVLGAHAARPGAETWLIWGDGAAGYGLAEFDTFVRHGVPVIALVGNDASWAQIAREQVEILGEATGTELRHSDYHVVAEGFGAHGLRLATNADIPAVLDEARRLARAGHPVLINAILASTDFRKGSISI